MNRSRFATSIVCSLLLLLARSGGASPHLRPRVTSCLQTWHVGAQSSVGMGQRTARVTCVDGDRQCDADARIDGRCTFAVSGCVFGETIAGSACGASTRVRPLGRMTAALGASLPRPEDGCEPGRFIQAMLRGGRAKPRPSRLLRLAMATRVDGGTQRHRLALRCLPATSAAVPQVARCAENPSGPEEPNELRLTLASQGSDLDLGWTGEWHGFPLSRDIRVSACLSGCDRGTDPHCDTTVVTGAGTVNGTTLGSPQPLLVQGVPVCVVNEWAEPTFAGGTADLATGAFVQAVGLRSRLFLTSQEHVCPTCVGDTCDSGANSGGTCSVSGAFTGEQPRTGPSPDCPPSAETLIATVPLQLALTTGTSALSPEEGGTPATPCAASSGGSPVVPQADACTGGQCDAACTGDACVGGELPCVDAKGGLSEVCCSNDTTRPCFPTAQGVLARTGSATTPVPMWPGPVYPKHSDVTAVATFCMSPTEASVVNRVAGLRGPGAVIAPFSAEWLTSSGGGGPVGPPPGPSPY